MKRLAITLGLLFAILTAAGCQQDFYARKIIEQDTGYGKMMLSLTGSDQSLLKQGRIDFHHRITTADKTKIDVWVLKAKNPDEKKSPPAKFEPSGTVVILHGLLDSKASYLSLGQRVSKMGYDAVLLDLRAHGASGGKYVTWGAKERTDVKQVVDVLTAARVVSNDVYVFGSTLGGAVALQYAAIDPRVKGVLALAPYKDITFVRRGLAMVAPTMSDKDFEKVLARAGKIADFDPAEASAINAASKLKCPLLVVHGLLDMRVPVENSQAIHKAANEPKQLIVVAWADNPTLLLTSEGWLAEQIDNIAKTGLKEPVPEPEKEKEKEKEEEKE